MRQIRVLRVKAFHDLAQVCTTAISDVGSFLGCYATIGEVNVPSLAGSGQGELSNFTRGVQSLFGE